MTTGTLFNLTSATGLDLRHIPRELRDVRSYGLADTRSWAAMLSDPELARPPHELLFGTTARIGEFYDVTPKWAQELAYRGHFHHVGNFYIALVSSAQALRVQIEADTSRARAEAGRRSGEARRPETTDVSGGSPVAADEAKFKP